MGHKAKKNERKKNASNVLEVTKAIKLETPNKKNKNVPASHPTALFMSL